MWSLGEGDHQGERLDPPILQKKYGNIQQKMCQWLIRGLVGARVPFRPQFLQLLLSFNGVYWWLVELPMWLTDGFSVTFFGRWRGQCAYTLILVWLTCGSRTRWLTCKLGGGGKQTSENSESLENSNFYKR